MARLECSFDTENHSLLMTSFDDCSGRPALKCVRSRDTACYPGATGSFPMTPAVRGMCILLLRYTLHHRGVLSDEEAALRGGARTPAAALDYALSKQNAWLIEMFGVLPSGISRARSLFKRINPERKRGGEVFVLLNSQMVAAGDLKLTAPCGRELDDLELTLLLSQFEAKAESIASLRCPARKANVKKTRVTETRINNRFSLAEDLVGEITGTLWNTNVFSRDKYKDSYKRFCQLIDSDVRGGFKSSPVADLDMMLSAVQKLAITERAPYVKALKDASPIRVATGAAAFSSIALVAHLAKRFEIPVEIDYRHLNTRTLIRDIQTWSAPSGAPDAVIVSVSCAAVFLQTDRRRDYIPLMVLPGNSHSIVKGHKANSDKPKKSEWTFISEELTTPSFYFSDMGFDSLRSLRRAQQLVEQQDLLQAGALEHENFNAVLWYPHYRFQQVFNGRLLQPLQNQSWEHGGNILFVRADRFSKLAVPLNIMMRDVWLDLRANPSLVRSVVHDMLQDDEYLRMLYRSSGLFVFPECTIDFLRAGLSKAQGGALTQAGNWR